MSEASKDTDQSMEDILQSIKRIIADEGEPEQQVPGSDVLELTELLAEDASPPPVTMESASVSEPEMPTSQGSQEALDALFSDAPVAAPVAAPAPVVAAPAPPPLEESKPVAAQKAAAPKAAPVEVPAPASASPAVAADDKLISDEALAASIAALHALPHPTHAPMASHPAVFRSGTTVEDLVIESLRPMLKEWLDTNLPAMVRSLVEREIRRLSL